ncbi:MAG: PD-(D/E)XK nuclease family protein, partial [Flavobacteriales bacterium]|nr:PD-(D/E)XK nuclease family protein [Flavobacteriales bacterium]
SSYRINGTIDRLDYLPGSATIRILDYKTGRVTLNKTSPVEACFEDVKNKEAFQGYLYAWLYDKKHPDKRIQVGYYTARHLNEGIQYLNGGTPVAVEALQEFEIHMKALIGKVLSSGFEQTTDEQKCRICPYKGICNRG